MATPLLLLIFSFLFTLTNTDAIQLIIVNNCNTTIWPATLATTGQKTPVNGGFTLHPHQSRLLRVPHHWSGRVWARQGCHFTQNSTNITCQTGDCNGLLQCNGIGGKPPATIVEMTFGTPASALHYYDVSLVDGFNLPVSVIPVVGNEKREHCEVATCEVNLNDCCPSALVVKREEKVVGCKSPCLATGFPRYCCTGEFSEPEKCRPTVFGRLFKAVCPRAYSHPFDEKTGLKTCNATRYLITFCPPT